MTWRDLPLLFWILLAWALPMLAGIGLCWAVH